MIRGHYLTSMDDLTSVIALRRSVFGDELGFDQRNEHDQHDDMAVYAQVSDESGAPAATGRLFIDEDDRFRIGRVCVRRDVRGQGYGDLVMRMLLTRALELNAPAVYTESLLIAVPFYARYGFKPISDVRLIGGALHRLMRISAEEIDFDRGCAGCGNKN